MIIEENNILLKPMLKVPEMIKHLEQKNIKFEKISEEDLK